MVPAAAAKKNTKVVRQKAIGKTVEGKIAEGVHAVDETLTIHVSGTVTKHADETYIPTADIPLKAALALVLEKAGVTRSAAANMLKDAMTEALTLGKNSEAALQESLRDVDEAMARVAETVGKLPPKIRSGKTIVKAQLEILELA